MNRCYSHMKLLSINQNHFQSYNFISKLKKTAYSVYYKLNPVVCFYDLYFFQTFSSPNACVSIVFGLFMVQNQHFSIGPNFEYSQLSFTSWTFPNRNWHALTPTNSSTVKHRNSNVTHRRTKTTKINSSSTNLCEVTTSFFGEFFFLSTTKSPFAFGFILHKKKNLRIY